MTKTGYKSGLLHKYKKLLQGFCDDEKFKDMIPILTHGDQSQAGEGDEAMDHQEHKEVLKAKRKETKSSIPKLDDEDRDAVLPIVIKLL